MAPPEGGAGGTESAQPAGTGTDGQDPSELLAEMASGDSPEGGEETPEQRISKLEAERDKWKGLSRKNEQLARSNKSAAEKLAEIEEASKTEAQKLADRAAAAEQRAAAAEALHHRTLAAAQHELDPELIPYLHGKTEEEITASAEALAKVINERVAKAAGGANGAGSGQRGTRPVESLRPGASPAGSTGPQSNEDLFRGFVAQKRQ